MHLPEHCDASSLLPHRRHQEEGGEEEENTFLKPINHLCHTLAK